MSSEEKSCASVDVIATLNRGSLGALVDKLHTPTKHESTHASQTRALPTPRALPTKANILEIQVPGKSKETEAVDDVTDSTASISDNKTWTPKLGLDCDHLSDNEDLTKWMETPLEYRNITLCVSNIDPKL